MASTKRKSFSTGAVFLTLPMHLSFGINPSMVVLMRSYPAYRTVPIKVSNVLSTNQSEAVLSDFELALAIAALEKASRSENLLIQHLGELDPPRDYTCGVLETNNEHRPSLGPPPEISLKTTIVVEETAKLELKRFKKSSTLEK